MLPAPRVAGLRSIGPGGPHDLVSAACATRAGKGMRALRRSPRPAIEPHVEADRFVTAARLTNCRGDRPSSLAGWSAGISRAEGRCATLRFALATALPLSPTPPLSGAAVESLGLGRACHRSACAQRSRPGRGVVTSTNTFVLVSCRPARSDRATGRRCTFVPERPVVARGLHPRLALAALSNG